MSPVPFAAIVESFATELAGVVAAMAEISVTVEAASDLPEGGYRVTITAEDGGEGARHRNAIGTYLHGSLLPKNPALTDALIRLALERRYGRPFILEPLDDATEARAHASASRVANQRARPNPPRNRTS